MTTTYTHFSDFAKEVRPPDKGILSRTLFSDGRLKAVLFGFTQGEAKMTLGDDTVEATPGPWVHMTKGLRLSIQAQTPVVLLLLLLKEPRPWPNGLQTHEDNHASFSRNPVVLG